MNCAKISFDFKRKLASEFVGTNLPAALDLTADIRRLPDLAIQVDLPLISSA